MRPGRAPGLFFRLNETEPYRHAFILNVPPVASGGSRPKPAATAHSMIPPRPKTKTSITFLAAFGLLLALGSPLAASPRDRIAEHRADQAADEALDDGADGQASAALPENVRVLRDVPYGPGARQRLDVYIPAGASAAPIIVMVHGGAWRFGDKGAQAVVQNKVARWAPRGFILVSTNYRLLPEADPVEQATDVARALAAVQARAASWGGDAAKCILMGHSAGAHLVSLLATSRSISAGIVPIPWLGTISLDSAALDVAKVMEAKHARFYDRAFGRDPSFWRSASPYHAVTGAARPMLMVCSTRRADSCAQSNRFAARATSCGVRASVLAEDFSHKEINQRLGEDPRYTAAVEAFMASLDPRVAGLLAGR